MYDGELGVLPGRAPLIGRLGYGELRIARGGETRRFFVDGGFAQVRANMVTVLTGRALRADEINVPAAGANPARGAARGRSRGGAAHEAGAGAGSSCAWRGEGRRWAGDIDVSVSRDAQRSATAKRSAARRG